MEIDDADAQMQAAHAAVGKFIARCALLDYRLSQFIARWFCSHDKQKFLSYTLRAMPFPEKRQVIEERLVNWHCDPDALRGAIGEIAGVLERRNLVANGVLSRRSSGRLCIKSFSGAKIISDDGAVDILDIDELDQWSERAHELTDRLLSLGLGLQDAAN